MVEQAKLLPVMPANHVPVGPGPSCSLSNKYIHLKTKIPQTKPNQTKNNSKKVCSYVAGNPVPTISPLEVDITEQYLPSLLTGAGKTEDKVVCAFPQYSSRGCKKPKCSCSPRASVMADSLIPAFLRPSAL